MVDKYDWETREDAMTLQRYQELKSDPERFNKAKSCIAQQVAAGNAVLKDKPLNAPLRHRNPAYVGKPDLPY